MKEKIKFLVQQCDKGGFTNSELEDARKDLSNEGWS